MSLTVAYLINQYPKVSHSFIRREIQALEAKGIQVLRYALRSCAAELVDEADWQELKKTRYILGVGGLGLLKALIEVFIQRPLRLMQALQQAVCLGFSSEKGILYHLIYLAEACVLLGWLGKTTVAHLHVHFGTNAATVALLCHKLGGPNYSFTVHGPEEFDKAEALALPEKIAQANFVIAISSFGKSQLYRWCSREHWPKIHIVHCGLDDLFLDQIQSQTSRLSSSEFVCVGRLCEQKGHLLLLEAAKHLADEGLEFSLTLVGDGPMRAEIERIIECYQLQNRVKITGWLSNAEVHQQILKARAMVLPSFAEGLPVAVMEAFGLNRPVITTYVGGIPELVEPGINGWLVPPGSVKGLIDAMRAALQQSPETLFQMGKAGAARVNREHNVLTEVNRLATLMTLSAEQNARRNSGQLTQAPEQPDSRDLVAQPGLEILPLSTQ
jgi:colanic acid/amylovoran biosynthesis glycosyltransferase